MMRHLSPAIQQSLADFPAIMLIGARQVGKSTLCKHLVEQGVMDQYITLDSTNHLTAALHDPDNFIRQFSSRTIIDEVQRAPELLRVIKEKIDDSDQSAGQYILTGSANILATPAVSESLAGRIDVFQLEGFSFAEISSQNQASPALDYLFNATNTQELYHLLQNRTSMSTHLSSEKLAQLIFYGGFPRVVTNESNNFKERWCNSYQTTYIERDVRNLNNRIDVIALAKVFQTMALQSGNLLVINNLANATGVDQRTAAQYLKTFELTFQTNLLHPWFANVRKRLIKTPKIFMNDSGYASYLFGIADEQALLNSPHRGALAETWFWAQLRTLISLTTGIRASFYRTQQNREVDFILEKGDCLRAIEFKWKESISHKDLSGLSDFMQANEGKNVLGIIVYCGKQLTTLAENILAVPLHYFL